MVGDWLNRLRRTQASTAHAIGVKGSGVSGAGARNGLSRLATTCLKNPTIPGTGAATWAAGATGALAAAAIAGVVDALSAVLAINACAVGIAPDSVTVADGCASVETTLTASTEVADVDEFSSDIAVSAVVECVEFDSVSAEVGVVGSVSGAWVAG